MHSRHVSPVDEYKLHPLHLPAVLQRNGLFPLPMLQESEMDILLLSDGTEWNPDKEEMLLHGIPESVRLQLLHSGWRLGNSDNEDVRLLRLQ